MTGIEAALKIGMHPDTLRYHVKRLKVGTKAGQVWNFTDSEVETIREYSTVPAQKFSLEYVKEHLHLTHPTLYRWCKKLGIPPRPSPYYPIWVFTSDDIEKIRKA